MHLPRLSAGQQPPAPTRREAHTHSVTLIDEARIRRLPLPARPAHQVPAPGEDGSPELIPPHRQRAWLALMVVVTLLLFAGRVVGLV